MVVAQQADEEKPKPKIDPFGGARLREERVSGSDCVGFVDIVDFKKKVNQKFLQKLKSSLTH